MKKRVIDLILVILIGLSVLFYSTIPWNCICAIIVCALAIINFRFNQSQYKNIYMLIAILSGAWVVLIIGTLFTIT